MAVSGSPPTGAPAGTGGIRGTTGAAAATGTGGASGGTAGTGGANGTGGTRGVTGMGGARGATGAMTGPGKAIGTPDISVIGAHAAAAAGSPAAASRHSDPPASATPGLNARATPHNPAPIAPTLMLIRSKIAIAHQTPSSALRIFAAIGPTEPSATHAKSALDRQLQTIGTNRDDGTRRTGPFPNGDVRRRLPPGVT